MYLYKQNGGISIEICMFFTCNPFPAKQPFLSFSGIFDRFSNHRALALALAFGSASEVAGVAAKSSAMLKRSESSKWVPGK